jgi:molybdopterin-containing oxidoreductase family iron-sulfur binding subunit
MTQPTILINLERCTGCWTCSLACKVGNKLAEDEWWQHVRTLGSGTGIDEPAGTWPDLHMSWMPIHTQDCTLCGERTEQGLEPFCTYNCPTKAMTFGDLEDPQSSISKRMAELKEIDYRIFRLPAWERTRPEIVYAEK